MFKVMTLNLNYYVTRHGPWEARRSLVCEAIRDYAPDVVALQAVRSDPTVEDGADQASQLSNLLPDYKYVYFQPGSDEGGGTSQGSAFLSRVPIVETDCLDLSLRPGIEDTNRRVFLRARFDHDGRGMNVYNAHYSWVLPQARDNLAESLPYMEASRGPALLVGDMNTLPSSDLWDPLKAAGWHDVWEVLEGEAEGFTFESDRLFMRIDFAWANEELLDEVAAIEVIAKERDGARMSDHLALLVTVA